ncbi:polysaccharide biosynthesis tyrosine autokinase [Devriesea agamarum]|uniref:polysaccharide biosynthesis tyrosine autokinase n=1 Tax=Devriesea agamarum TaxID=472569 RepID=UPI00071D045F|nr:polysaccharide biosynthesis tyrosine autokinase [Devriesea agamarum]
MTIEDFFRLTLRHIGILIGSIIVCLAASYGMFSLRTPVYQASALGYVSANGGTDSNGNPVTQASGNMQLQQDKAQSYLPLFTTRAVGEGIVKRLDLADASPDAIAGSLSVTVAPSAPVITVTAPAATPEQARDIANAAVESAAAEARKLEVGSDNPNARPIVALVPYQTALTPGAPVSPNLKSYLGVGLIVGIVLGYAIAWLLHRSDTRVRSVEDVSSHFDLPVLGVMPAMKDMKRSAGEALPEPTHFAVKESIRKLRTNLRYLNVDNPPRVIVVTSAIPAEGKSTVAGNLARVLARSGQKTLLIDADLRRPVVYEEFGLDGSLGLTQLLSGAAGLDDCLIPSNVPNLQVLPAGQIPPNPSELLGSHRMESLLRELRKEYFIVIDAPPILPVTDGVLLARHADGAILVIGAGKARREVLKRAVDQLRTVDAKVLGAVINQASTKFVKRLAYGDAEYGYGVYGYSAYGYGSGYVKGSGRKRGGSDSHAETDVEVIPEVEPVLAAEAGSEHRRASGRRADVSARATHARPSTDSTEV